MKLIKTILVFGTLLIAFSAHAEKLTVAAAADLKFAMDELVVSFKKSNPSDEVDVIYGSSGKFHTQIQQGAPYDMFFSADIGFPRELAAAGTIFQPVVLARRIEQVPHQGRALLQVVEQCSWSLQER